MASLKERYQEFKKDLFIRRLERTTDESQGRLYEYLLQARVGVGKELGEPGAEKVSGKTSEIWDKATKYVDKLVEIDPQRAMELGVTLSLLPKDTENEEKYQWFRGDGPVILAKLELRGNLQKFLDSGTPKALEFKTKILEYMAFDITKMKNKTETFSTPECYMAVASLYLGTKLEEMEMCNYAVSLSQTALRVLSNPETVQVINYYRRSKDTAWLPKALAPFFGKN